MTISMVDRFLNSIAPSLYVNARSMLYHIG